MRKAAFGICLAVFFCSFLSPVGASNMDGIWKDVDVGQSGGRFSVYLQTYETGSAVAILVDSTASPLRLYAFLVPNYPNGFEADEIGGANASISIEGLGEVGTTAEIQIGENTDNVSLYRWFRAAAGGENPAPDDGIFKDAPSTEATSFNMFFQTYPTDGSAVAVITRDGGATYYAFLQPGFTGSFNVDDFLGQGAHLDATIDSADPSSFTLTPPQGSVSAGLLYKWFQAPVTANTYNLAGTVLYNGASLTNEVFAAPFFSVRNIDTGVQADQVLGTYDMFSGAYTLSNVPGNANIRVSLGLYGDYDTLPFNFLSSTVHNIEGLTQAERQNYDLQVLQILHLTAPYDNNETTLEPNEYSEHTLPLTFEWEALPEADGYDVLIDRMRSLNHPDGYGKIGTVVSEEIAVAEYAPTLDPSMQNEHYEFTVYANNGSLSVGEMLITFENGASGRYAFRVVSP